MKSGLCCNDGSIRHVPEKEILINEPKGEHYE